MVQVEETGDDDTIRFDAAGAEVATITANGVCLAQGTRIDEFSTDTTLGDNSNLAVPTERAVKTYVDTSVTSISDADNDTKIQVEESADEDIIRFDTAGAERVVIDNSGKVGIGTSVPDGSLHVHTASAGTVVADTNADDLVVETSAGGGLSILTPNTATGNIYFGDPDFNSAGIVRYNHSSDVLELAASGNVGATLDGNGQFNIGVASIVSADTDADDLVVEKNDNGGLSILTPNNKTGNIFFGDPQLTSAGIVLYNHNTNMLEFGASGNTGMKLDDSRRLTLDQLTGDGEILAFKSSDIGHGATAITDTETYGFFKKFSSTAGGLKIESFSDEGGSSLSAR